MLGADGFWQTTWPIIAAPLFLILGYFGTFITNARLEERKHHRDRERRTFEWQRENLIELQEMLAEHNRAGLTAMYHFNELDRDGLLDERRQHETPTPESLRSGQEAQDYAALCTRIRVRIERCVDREIAGLCDPYMASMRDGLTESDPSQMFEYSSRSGKEFNAAIRRIGELLRTTYA